MLKENLEKSFFFNLYHSPGKSGRQQTHFFLLSPENRLWLKQIVKDYFEKNKKNTVKPVLSQVAA